MIKLKQHITVRGKEVLVFEVSGLPGAVKTIEIDCEEIGQRLRLLKQITGRQPTLENFEDVTVTFIEQLRRGEEALIPRFDFSALIGVDLERRVRRRRRSELKGGAE